MSNNNGIITGRLSSISQINTDGEITGISTGDISGAGGLTTSGNISGGYILGNASQMTGLNINNNYGDPNVAAYLASGADSSAISTSGYINASFFKGNGSTITGITGGTSTAYPVEPTFSGGLPAEYAGQWLQVYGNITLPQAHNAPLGSFFYFTNQGSGPAVITVNDIATEFIYYIPLYDTSNRSITLFPGQWAILISRGTNEWDIVATNLSNAFKQSISPSSAAAKTVAIDNLLVYNNGTGFYARTNGGGNYTLAISGFYSGSINGYTVSSVALSGSNSSLGISLSSAGSQAQGIMTDTGSNRSYRYTFSRIGSGLTFGISLERLTQS